MNLGQILLVLASIMILGMVSLNVNSMLLNKEVTMTEAKVSLAALDLSKTLMNEILQKNFDSATPKGKKIDSVGQFTLANLLGPDGSENSMVSRPEAPDTASAYQSLQGYDDIDDYDGYVRNALTEVGDFRLESDVYYVQESNLDAASATPTYFKKIVITVTNANMRSAHTTSTTALYRN